MSDKATEVIDWLEQVAGVQLDDHQREVIRRLYDIRVLWPTPHHLSVLGRSTGGDRRHPRFWVDCPYCEGAGGWPGQDGQWINCEVCEGSEGWITGQGTKS